jgi:drug/metabolite transporter (DMT)-like permease
LSKFTLGILYAITTGLCWAVLAIGLKYALHFTSTGTVVWVRMIVAFGILFAHYLIRSPQTLKQIFYRPPTRVLVAGIFLACNYFGYMKGLELTSASNAQIMIQLGPLTLLFMGVFYFREHIRWQQWIGIGIALLGFVFYNWDQLLVTISQHDMYVAGNIWLLFAALTWAVFAVLQKIQFEQGWTPQMTNLLIYAVCLVCLTPTATPSELVGLNFWQYFVLFLLGLNTLVAYGAFAEAMHLIPASYVSLIISVNPLLTIFLVGLFAHFGLTFISPEPIMWRGYLGAALVVSGVSIAVSLKKRRI